MAANFDREFDAHNAIVSNQFLGAGGVDAADRLKMLARSSMRWAERKKFLGERDRCVGLRKKPGSSPLRSSFGEETRTECSESERGVHRLVRHLAFRPSNTAGIRRCYRSMSSRRSRGGRGLPGSRSSRTTCASKRSNRVVPVGSTSIRRNRSIRIVPYSDWPCRRLTAGALANAEPRRRD